MKTNVLALVLFALCPASAAQSTRIVKQEGDNLGGLGAVTALLDICVDDGGHGLVLLDSDFPDLLRDEALLLDGAVLVAREGDAVANPSGMRIADISSIARTAAGDIASIQDLTPLAGLTYTAVYWNEQLLAMESLQVAAPEVPGTSTWKTFQALEANANGSVLVLGEILNPSVAGPFEDALVRFQLDAAGQLQSTHVLATKLMFLPALGETITVLGNSELSLAQNEHGDFLTYVQGLGGGALLINLDTVVARQGSPAPVPGRNWATFALTSVALNALGDHAYSGLLDGSDDDAYLLVVNGEKFVQEGDILPSFSASPLASSSGAPIFLGNNGAVYWRARSATDEGFLRGDRPILQRNATLVGGDLVVDIATGAKSFHVSPDGRFFLGRVELQSAGETLVLVDFGVVVPVPGCHGNQGTLRVTDGLALPGDHLTFALDGGQDLGVVPMLVFASGAAVPGSPCGLSTPIGEVLIAPATRFATLFGPSFAGSAIEIDVPIPADLALVDTTAHVQGAFLDVGDVSPAENYRPTNGLRIVIGAP